MNQDPDAKQHVPTNFYLPGTVGVVGAGGVGVGGVAEPFPPAGRELSDEADQSDGVNQPDSSGSSDEVPPE